MWLFTLTSFLLLFVEGKVLTSVPKTNTSTVYRTSLYNLILFETDRFKPINKKTSHTKDGLLMNLFNNYGAFKHIHAAAKGIFPSFVGRER